MAPIHDAVRSVNVAELRRLLAAGVSLDELDGLDGGQHGLTPLQNLCEWTGLDSERAACVVCFELLRDAGANLEARSSPSANTALHYAANSGWFEILSLLLEAGVNVNVANSGGYTPLHWAARGDFRTDTESVELLLRAGAAVNTRITSGLDGYTPFDVALLNGHRRAYPLFLRAGAEFRNAHHNPYTLRVQRAGGFKRYEQAHLARITAILETPLLPPELVRKILEFWLHAGYY